MEWTTMMVSDRRRMIERVALRCRFAFVADSPVPSWTDSQRSEVAALAPDSFADPDLRAAASTVDAGAIPAPSIEQLLREPLGDDEAEVRFHQVRTAMTQYNDTYRVVFNIHARVPLLDDLVCDPFGGATEIVLQSGINCYDADAHSLELVAVAISVPYKTASVTGLNGPSELVFTTRGIESPAFNHARLLLDHVITLLHLKGVSTRYSDFEAGRGAPYQCVIRRQFADGTIVEAAAGLPAGFYVPGSLGPARVCRPLSMERSELRNTFDTAATELALMAGSRVLSNAEHLRRLALLIESSFSGDPWDVRLRTDPTFQTLLTDALAADPTLADGIADIVSELVYLRNQVAHLQVRQDAKRTRRFGIAPYDLAVAERLRRIIPIAEALALRVMERVVPSETTRKAVERDPPFHELAALWEARDRYCTTDIAKLNLARYVKARLGDGVTHRRIATIAASVDEVIDQLDPR